MIVLKLTSPNGQLVTVVIGAADSAVIVRHPIKPEGDFILGETKMIEGTQLFVGGRSVIALETVEEITKAIGRIETTLSPERASGYQIASDQ